MGALNIDFQQAMQTIAVLAGGNYSGLTYENGQVRNVYVQSQASGRSALDDVLSYYAFSLTHFRAHETQTNPVIRLLLLVLLLFAPFLPMGHSFWSSSIVPARIPIQRNRGFCGAC